MPCVSATAVGNFGSGPQSVRAGDLGLTVTLTFHQHANICLPEWIERSLQPLLITTDMHRIHHSLAFNQANANYGAVLSI